MNLLFLALVPIVIILVFVYKYDKYEKEPLSLMLLCVLGGTLSVIPILPLERVLSMPMANMTGYTKAAWNAFVVAAFSEELFKYIIVLLIIWRNRNFNEKFDGIVYAVCVSLGFAAVENVLYVMDSGATTAYMRAITAVPGHAIFGITMGFYLGRAKMLSSNTGLNLCLALFLSILIHGIYDFILMSQMPFFILIFIAFLLLMYRYGFNQMEKHIITSRFRPKGNN